jgi:NAD dependent epimerase/dehydratase
VNNYSKRALVTGADGFVGSHLVEELIDRGYQVRGFVRYTSANDRGYLEEIGLDKRSEVEVIAGDIRDGDAIRKAAKDTDVIFHLAALVGIPYSYVHPLEVIETNVMGTVNVLLAARDYGGQRVIHTSTGEVYGTAQYVPIDENHPLQGQSPYSASKIGAEKIVDSFHASFGLPVTIVRPFNIFGPRQSARAVIPTIITQGLVKDEIKLGNFEATRDFTYVKDTVNGFIMTFECPEAIGKTVNLGSNYEVSIGELAEMILRLIGRDVKLIQEDQRVRPTKSEVQRLWAENALAKQIIGWKPNVTLEEGLKYTIAWISQNLDKYRIGEYAV